MVAVSVQELWPSCAKVGTFRIRGHAGVNRIVFRARVGKRQLGPGTYRIRGRAGGKRVFTVKIVVVARGTPSGAALRAMRRANVCGTGGGASRGSGGGPAGAAASSSSSGGGAGTNPKEDKSASGAGSNGRSHRGGVLGATRESISSSISGSSLQLGLLIILSVAIFLLALSAVPRSAVPHPAAGAFLAESRVPIAVAGSAAFVAFLIAYLT